MGARQTGLEQGCWNLELFSFIDPDGNPILIDQHVDSPLNVKNKTARKT
jgi:hypothetical protein